MLRRPSGEGGEREGYESGKREGECEAVHLLLNVCIAEEQEMLENKGRMQSKSRGKEQAKVARAQKVCSTQRGLGSIANPSHSRMEEALLHPPQPEEHQKRLTDQW